MIMETKIYDLFMWIAKLCGLGRCYYCSDRRRDEREHRNFPEWLHVLDGRKS